jgi:hypothetical protein
LGLAIIIIQRKEQIMNIDIFGDEKEEKDIVGEYIKLRKEKDSVEEQIKALEILILNDEKLCDDNRIKIISGRKSISVSESGYKKLESVGVDIYITEKRLKELKEFDATIRELILANPENYVEKITKASIRVNK